MTIVRRSTTMLAGSLSAGAALIGFSACAPGWDVVRLSTGLYPTFQYSVTDYVNRCDPNDPTDITVSAPANTAVDIANQGPKGDSYSTQVSQQENEAFTIVVTHPDNTQTTHYVRCLPAEFPEWEATRNGATQAEFYSTVIIEGFGPSNWPVIFDTNGVPVWWSDPGPNFLNTPLANKNLATMPLGGTMVERKLDGSVVRVLDTTPFSSDFHDVIVKPNNGNYVMASLENRACNLAPWGEGQGTCLYHTFQEMTPAGQVVWEWHAEEDIPLSETTPNWREVRGWNGTADPWHYNSVEWTGDGFLISFRHMDAIYKIDYDTKNVVWKLGGSSTPQRLQVLNDQVFANGGSISGQHDARMRTGSDDSANVYQVTLFDNGTDAGRAPRSVVYEIDEDAGTATLVGRISDSVAPVSECCGSTRALPTGNFVTGWGGTPWFTENQPNGTQVFRLDANFIYRVIPIMPGLYSRQELRDGMNAQFDGPNAVNSTATRASDDSSDLADQAWRFALGQT